MRRRIDRNPDYQLAAYHEAGHAVVGLWLGWQVRRIVVHAHRPGEGLVKFGPNNNPSLSWWYPGAKPLDWTSKVFAVRQQIKIFLAGPLAEARLLHTPLRSLGARSDFEKVMRLLDELEEDRRAGKIPFYLKGCGSKSEFTERVRRQARRLVSQPKIWNAIAVLAQDLISWGELDGEDVAQTVQWTFGPKNQPSLF